MKSYNQQQGGASPLISMDRILRGASSPVPQMDVKRQGFMFGDVGYEDDGQDGEPLDPYGEVYEDALLLNELQSGEPAAKQGFFRSKGGKMAMGVAGGALGGLALRYLLANGPQAALSQVRNLPSRMIPGPIRQLTGNQRQTLGRQIAKRISPDTQIPFIQVKGGSVNMSPLPSGAKFAAKLLKQVLDNQQLYTPFPVDVITGVAISNGYECKTPSSLADSRIYAGVILRVGQNGLNAAPNTILNIEGTLPLESGGFCTITTGSLVVAMDKSADLRMFIHPYTVQALRPELVQGRYSGAAQITLRVTNITNAQVSMIIPGTSYEWTRTTRAQMRSY